jgi:putative transposase
MPQIKIYIHFVWSTKHRIPYLATKEMRRAVWIHIRENARKKGIFVDHVDGYSDHCHCLVSLAGNQTIEDIMHLIKGESAHWINRNPDFKDLLNGQKFEWQTEYFAVSVSESIVQRVRYYIQNQEKRHSKKTYKDEFEEFIKKYKFQRFDDR